jgi:hypothetical protein
MMKSLSSWLLRFRSSPDLRVIAVVLAFKVILLGFGAASVQVLSDRRPVDLNEAFSVWNRWDAPHYLFLAEHGYQSSGEQRYFLTFFPLFPWLVRLVAPLCGTYLAAALVISTVMSLALAMLLRRLAELDRKGLGEPAVWFLFVFPTAYFLHIGYTESLFLALAIGAFLAARTGQWRTAGILGALAGLTRINALFLVPALAAEAWTVFRAERRWRWQWLWLGSPFLGLAGYLALNSVVGGHPFRFLEYQSEHWNRTFAWPWVGMRGSYASMIWRAPAEAHMVGFEELFFVLLGLVATVLSWVRQRRSYAIWMTGNWLLFACQPFVFAVPRFALALFPLFLLEAELGRNRAVAAILTFWSLLFFALFAGQFVQGRWAF